MSAVGAGPATTPTQLIALRSTAGIAASFCLPGAVGVAAHAFPAPHNPRRGSAAFTAMGGGQAVGFGLGLVLGGVCAGTLGWRWGFYCTAILNIVVLSLAVWALPRGVDGSPLGRATFAILARDVDWIGALLISTCLALLSYELAVATGSDTEGRMSEPLNIVLLGLPLALLPTSGLWMR